MQFYWSWKKLPEFQQRSKNEYWQAIWQVGLKPFTHWQVWGGLILISAMILFGVETLFGLLLNQSFSLKTEIFVTICLLIIICASLLFYRHTYLQFLRSFISKVAFDPTTSRWNAFVKSSVVIFVPFVLILLCMCSIDWIINSYDENINPRFEANKTSLEPIADSENSFIYMTGFMAPIDASPFKSGSAYIAAANEAILRKTTLPKNIEGLTYTEYNASTPNIFCRADQESCWYILRQDRDAVTKWLASNKVMLARYKSITKYPRWQNSILINYASPIPSYSGLIRGQSLLQCAAMLAIERGHVELGLKMIGDDILFVRSMLEGKGMLIDKMIASSMLSRDLALLAETLQERPIEVSLHWKQIEKMVEPLTAEQVSLVEAFKFGDQKRLSVFDGDILNNLSKYNGNENVGKQQHTFLVNKWLQHHLKKNATINLLIKEDEMRNKFVEVHDVRVTRPIYSTEFNDRANGLTWWHYNQVGKTIYFGLQFSEYVNRLFDLNTFNNLVRLQLTIISQRIAPNNVTEFLSTTDRSLWNPEVVKPFEWDSKLEQIYFIPVSDSYKKNYSKIGGVRNRLGLSVE